MLATAQYRDDTRPARADGVFVREGDVWRVGYGGLERRLKDSIGMRYLAELLAQPGHPLHALELSDAIHGVPGASGQTRRPRTAARSPGGPHLDTKARAFYEARLGELRTAFAEAERDGDTVTAARAREELRLLSDEVGRVAGIGRFRDPATPTERARVSVGKAVRRAITRIASAHEPLGRHLDHAIRTGTFLSYAADPQRGLHWHVER